MMIIELFGPPGAEKTTVTPVRTLHLQKLGYDTAEILGILPPRAAPPSSFGQRP
jgi:hypothetical protein